MSAKGYYKRYGRGYVCPVCGTIYEQPWDKNLAIQCCADKKPLNESVLREAAAIVESLTVEPVKYPRLDKPAYAGIKYPDKNRHWRRGNPGTQEQTIADYHKARRRIKNELKISDIATLQKLFEPIATGQTLNKHKRSPLQRLAFAFHNHDWDNARQAALDLADEQAAYRVQRFAEHIINFLMSEKDLDIDRWLNER